MDVLMPEVNRTTSQLRQGRLNDADQSSPVILIMKRFLRMRGAEGLETVCLLTKR
jgi:hypothetical protein